MITVACTVKGFRSDEDGESIITFRVPMSHKQQATDVSNLVKQPLYLIVHTQDELVNAAEEDGE